MQFIGIQNGRMKTKIKKLKVNYVSLGSREAALGLARPVTAVEARRGEGAAKARWMTRVF
jgi:hypothetical protein